MTASLLPSLFERAAGHPPSTCDPRAIMATKLDKQLKRELEIDGKPYMLTIAPDGLKLVEKGRRNGLEMSWKDIVSGDAALAAALNASADKLTD
jgi:hypothetical protein